LSTKSIGSFTEKRTIAAIIIIILGISSISFVSFLLVGTNDRETTTIPTDDNVSYNYSMPALITVTETIEHEFADFIPYIEDYQVSAQNYSISPDLSNVAFYGDLPDMNNDAIQMIEQNGFVVIPQREHDQIYEILEENYWTSTPSFITSDAVLHSFHVLYDMALRIAETWTFWDLLGNLTNSLLNASYFQYLGAPEGRWKDAALRNVMFFSVAMKLLDENVTIPAEVEAEVTNVLDLIEQHLGLSENWFMHQLEDFSQYVPRGHYTRNELFKKYFKAMMWFGRITFRLIPDGTFSPNEVGKNETAQAILISLALEQTINGLSFEATGYDIWDALYEPTAFFVGVADDLVPVEYLEIIGEIYGTNISVTSLDNDSNLDALIRKLVELRPPRILSGPLLDTGTMNMTMGLRFMGQRFIPDSYILDQLVYVHVGTLSEPRLMPKGLDVMAALGSARAWELLDDQKHYFNYIEQMEKMCAYIDNVSDVEWTQNLYWLWLYSLLPLLVEPGEGFPFFMQSSAWVDKQLMTALGSWTELRHDTILYAKQSYGSITSAPSTPPGYVEPVPRLYARLAALCSMMVRGFESRSILPDVISQRLLALHDFLRSLEAISVKELDGELLNSTDLDLIHNSGSVLEYITEMPRELSTVTSSTDENMAVIADVHTDLNTGKVLEEGVGYPMEIFVAVHVNDEIILTRGGTFSYYEFPHPMDDRLTDEAWQEMLENEDEPPMPSWSSSFVCLEGFSGLQIDSENLLMVSSQIHKPTKVPPSRTSRD
jgi:hypothetical protein